MKLQYLETKRHYISDKFIIGIDPAKHKHQVMVLDPEGIPVGKSFSFQNSYNGFHFKSVLKIDSDTARYLFSKYLTAKDFSAINVFYESIELVAVSRNHHGTETLKALKEAAAKSIGLPLDKITYLAHRMAVNMWIEQIRMLKIQQYNILTQLHHN